MADGTNYIVLYTFSVKSKGIHGGPRLWTRSKKMELDLPVWIPHVDLTGTITAIYLRSYGNWVIKVTTSDGQTSNYIDVILRDIPGKDMQPRRVENVRA